MNWGSAWMRCNAPLFHYWVVATGEDKTITHFFESNPYYHIESKGDAILIFGKERLASITEIKAIFDFGKRLKDTISK